MVLLVTWGRLATFLLEQQQSIPANGRVTVAIPQRAVLFC